MSAKIEGLHSYTIVYVSTARYPLSVYELESIMHDSKKYNNAKKITGLLIYAEGVFLQVLQGKKEDVCFLFNKIEMDFRHFGIIKTLEGYHEHSFFKWNIGIKMPNKSELSPMLRYANVLEDNDFLDLIKSQKNQVLSFVNSFYKNNIERVFYVKQ